jgi:hypothetical protein
MVIVAADPFRFYSNPRHAERSGVPQGRGLSRSVPTEELHPLFDRCLSIQHQVKNRRVYRTNSTAASVRGSRRPCRRASTR